MSQVNQLIIQKEWAEVDPHLYKRKKYLEILQWLVTPTIKKISAEYVGLDSQAHKILHIGRQGYNNKFDIQWVPPLRPFDSQ